jgi:hypothetical protein
MGLSLSPERGHEGCICEVLQEDRCLSMYGKLCAVIIMRSHIVLLFPHPGMLIHNILLFIFVG